MTKEQFIEELRGYLSSIPKDELESAVKYYEEYLEDSEDADDAIKSLGTPKSVADQILSDMGRVETSTTENVPAVAEKTEDKKEKKKEKRGLTGLEITLIIIVCILTSPLWIAIGLAALSIVFAIILAVLFILLAIALVSVVIGIAGLAGFIASFAVIVSGNFAAAFTLMGISLFAISLGCLLAIPGWAIVLKVVPAFFRGVVKLFKMIFRIK